MLPTNSNTRGRNPRRAGPLTAPRLTARRVIFVVFILVSGFLFIRWSSAPENQCVPTTGLQRPFQRNSVFQHPKSEVNYHPFDDYLKNSRVRHPPTPHTIPLTAGDTLPKSCLTKHFVSGEPCHSSSTPRLDFVWTWVNISDPLIRQNIESMSIALQREAALGRPFQNSLKFSEYRDHDELRYSVRSVVKNFAASSRNVPPKFHVIVSDVAVEQCDPKFPPVRFAQLPQWLNPSDVNEWQHDKTLLSLWNHAQLFSEYAGSIFHSYAIETVLEKIPGLSEHFVYMNDDFFLISSLRTADFYTNALGPVLRLQSNLLVPPHRDGLWASNEWQALQHTNGLLSDRFSARWRPYNTHQAKVLGKSILTEIKMIWEKDIKQTASRPFRDLSVGEGDAYMMFLYSHYIIERHREALLWTWLVARIGSAASAPGIWGPTEAQRAWREVGGQPNEEVVKLHRAKKRDTLEPRRLKKIVEDEEGGSNDGDRLRTTYIFSSEDGYPFLNFGRRGTPSWVPEMGKYDPTAGCQMKFTDCFASERDGEQVTLDGAFKRIAFDRSAQCGDCIITALIASSGTLGLSAFLPAEGQSLKPSPLSPELTPSNELRYPDVPMLPMTLKWWDTSFSLDAVLSPYSSQSPSINLREFTTSLIARYRYVIGDTPSKFASLKNPAIARRELGDLPVMDTKNSIALLCLNDDVTYGDWKVAELMAEFMEERFPSKADWEV